MVARDEPRQNRCRRHRASVGSAAACLAAEPPPIVVEIESPLASTAAAAGLPEATQRAGPSPAVVLLHSCNGDWRRLDERWGKRIASWGYVALTVDSFGPRGLKKLRRAPAE